MYSMWVDRLKQEHAVLAQAGAGEPQELHQRLVGDVLDHLQRDDRPQRAGLALA